MLNLKQFARSIKNTLVFLSISILVLGFTGGTVYLFYYLVQTNKKLYSVLFIIMAGVLICYFIYRAILNKGIIRLLKGLARASLILIYILFIFGSIIMYSSFVIRNIKLGLILFPLFAIFIIYCMKIFKRVFFVKNLLKNSE